VSLRARRPTHATSVSMPIPRTTSMPAASPSASKRLMQPAGPTFPLFLIQAHLNSASLHRSQPRSCCREPPRLSTPTFSTPTGT